MIYDCFLFNNELDLLEIRLNELNNYVDKFVIVESTKTFTLKNKPLYFEINKNKFKKFFSKIFHIVVTDSEKAPDVRTLKYYKQAYTKDFNYQARSVEAYQRNYIFKGLKNCTDKDIILISDIDEIPSINSIKSLNKIINNECIGFKQRMFYYYFNIEVKINWIGTRAILYSQLKHPQEIRQINPKTIIPSGGWHFSYLGGIENIKVKLNSICHQEYNNDYYMNTKRLNFNIRNNFDIFERQYEFYYRKIDTTFPKYIKKNQFKYKKYIKKYKKFDTNTIELQKEIVRLRGQIFNLRCELEKNKTLEKNIK